MRKLSIPCLIVLSVASFGAQATNNSLSFKYEHFFHPENDSRRATGQANDYELKMEYAHKFRGENYDWTDGLVLGFENYFQKTNGKANVNFTLKSSYNIESDYIDGLEYGPILEYQWRERGRTQTGTKDEAELDPTLNTYDDAERYERLKLGVAVAYRFNSEWRIRARYRYLYNIDYQKIEYKDRETGEAIQDAQWQDYDADGIYGETNFYVYYTPEYYDRDLKLYVKGTIYNVVEKTDADGIYKCDNPDQQNQCGENYQETGERWKPAVEIGAEYQTMDWGSFIIAYKARPYDNSFADPKGNLDGIEVGYRMRW